MLHLGIGLVYPVTGSRGSFVSARSVQFLPAPPTVASRVSMVRKAVCGALFALGLHALFTRGLDLLQFGITFRMDGVVCGFDPNLLLRARSRLSDFTAGRRVASVAALARPI